MAPKNNELLNVETCRRTSQVCKFSQTK